MAKLLAVAPLGPATFPIARCQAGAQPLRLLQSVAEPKVRDPEALSGLCIQQGGEDSTLVCKTRASHDCMMNA